MKKLILQKREITGKKVKSLRKEGLIPAVVYNSKVESFNTLINKADAQWLHKNTTSTTVLDVEFEKRTFKCLVKNFDINSVTGDINHISIFEIDTSATMVFTIPFEIIGISPAVKNNLGVLINPLTSIEVQCTLADLVPSIEIDISGLEHPGQTITVEDIKLPNGMNLINTDLKNAAIITITELQKVEEVETSTESTETTEVTNDTATEAEQSTE